MAPERTAACTLTLPPEIWRIVLHSFGTYRQDLAELWTGCRGVSKHFKHEVEEFFIAHYLPVTLLGFDMTTSQIFNRNSRIEFHDHKIQTTYSHVSVDRAKAFFQAKNSDGATLLEKMHNRGRYSRPSHLVDFSRPSDDVAWPGVFFHANGDVEVDWRELFAALFAEDMYHYRTGLHPVRITSTRKDASGTVTERTNGSLMASRVYECKEVGMFEPRMSLSPHADAPRNYVFRMAIKRLWPTDLGWEVPLVDQ